MRKTWAALPLALLIAAGCEKVADETPQQPTTTTTTAPVVTTTTSTVLETTTTTPVGEGTTTTVRVASAAKRGQFCSTEGETAGSLTCTTSATENRKRWR